MSYLDKTGLTRLWAQIVSRLGEKIDKVEGKGLSTNDYSDEEAAKVAAAASLNIENGTGTNAVKTSGATEASGDYSFAEGQVTIASGDRSHAEGGGTIASGLDSHAEGSATMAKGYYSHAEGYGSRFPITLTGEASATTYTYSGGSYLPMPVGSFVFLANNIEKLVQVTASTDTTITVSETLSEESLNEENAFNIQGAAIGDYSHVEGSGTSAGGEAQHVQGKFNIYDNENKYAHIVGNGHAFNRENAHTLDWDGNAWFQGDVYTGGTSQDDANAKQLATQEYVNERVPKFTYSTVDLEAGVSELAEGEVYFVYE